MKIALSLLVAALLPWHSAAWAFEDQFNSLDRQKNWCPCQINMAKAPVEFKSDRDGTSYARITANEHSLGGNVCRLEAPDFECGQAIGSKAGKGSPDYELAPDKAEPLGPSLIPRLKAKAQAKGTSGRAKADRNQYCNVDVLLRVCEAGEECLCMQRQELRLTSDHYHAAGEAHLYSLRFRLPKKIQNQSDSLRWVTAQWKHEPVNDAYEKELGKKWGASPFLAQRFDNGILHVTVQDKHCRCEVATASSRRRPTRVGQKETPQNCKSTHPDTENQRCKPTDLTLEHGNAVLPSPRGQWVELKYHVQAGRKAKIEIYNKDQLVVRVTGKIGYDFPEEKKSKTKFKVGPYRDYQPFPHEMDIDWIKVEPAPQ